MNKNKNKFEKLSAALRKNLIKRKEKKNGDNAWFLDKENGRRKRND